MIVRFRSRPCEISAARFDGVYENALAIVAWADGAVSADNGDGTLSITTLEGTMKAIAGDWIVKGLKGEFYPVKDEIMQLKYEVIPDEPSI